MYDDIRQSNRYPVPIKEVKYKFLVNGDGMNKDAAMKLAVCLQRHGLCQEQDLESLARQHVVPVNGGFAKAVQFKFDAIFPDNLISALESIPYNGFPLFYRID